MLDWNFREQSGLEIIDLGFGSHLPRILIETLREGLRNQGKGPAWLPVNSMSLQILSSVYGLTPAWKL